MTVPRPHGNPSPTQRREEAAPRSCPEVWLEGRSQEKPGEGRAGQAPLPSSRKVPASSPVLKYLFQHKLFSIEERLPRLWLPLWHLFSKSVQICSKTCQGWRDGLTPVCHPSEPSGAPKSHKYRASRQLCVMGWDIVGMPRGTPWNPPGSLIGTSQPRLVIQRRGAATTKTCAVLRGGAHIRRCHSLTPNHQWLPIAHVEAHFHLALLPSVSSLSPSTPSAHPQLPQVDGAPFSTGLSSSPQPVCCLLFPQNPCPQDTGLSTHFL